jgi:hypothetical protein
MPEYVFEHRPTGERRTEIMSMEETPEVGGAIERDGRVWHKLPPSVPAPHLGFKPFVAHSQPRHDPCAEKHDKATGYPVIESQRGLDEYISKRAESNQPVAWDR